MKLTKNLKINSVHVLYIIEIHTYGCWLLCSVYDDNVQFYGDIESPPNGFYTT